MTHRSSKQTNAHSQRGQGLVEYVILLSLVALAVVLIIRVLEPAIANVFSELVTDAPVAPPSLLSYTPPPVTDTPTITPTNDPSIPTNTPTVPPAQSPTPTASNTPTVTPSPSNTPTATFTPSPTATPIPQILFVVGNTTLSAGDTIIRTQLNALAIGKGYSVQTVDDNVVQTADATGRRLVVISSSVDDAVVTNKFRTVPVPVMLWEDSLLDDMGMVGTTGNPSGTANNQKSVIIINNTHALAGNLPAGEQIVYSGNNGEAMTWGSPNNSAILIATLANNSSRYPIFAYASGVTMPGLSAPAKRVGFFLTNDGPQVLTSAGLTLFNAAVNWALN